MTGSISKQAQQITKRHPFLKNFPFQEFSIEFGELPKPAFLIDELEGQIDPSESKLIKFVYEQGKGSISIVIFEPELIWITETAHKIKDLDKIAKLLNKAISSNDLLTKRDAVDLATVWCGQLEDNRTRLSYSTMADILVSLIKDKQQMVDVINKLARLAHKKGLVSMDQEEYQIILTYYQFQLIYTKLILGLVIASKISI